MEVHHHPQVENKRFKEYFLEFVMIFLAVTLGFFAENLREHITDTNREKEYATELYKELKADSIAVVEKINSRLNKEKYCDYLYSYIKDSSLTDLPKKFYLAYTVVFYLINSYTFEPMDGVLNQLKTSGSLRYFKNAELQKLFGDMSVAINNVRYRNDQEYQFFASPIKAFLLQHYDFKWMNDARSLSPDAYSLDLMNLYMNSDTTIKAVILNLPTFSRSEAANMVMFYKVMMMSSRTLQMNDYIKTNAKLLQVLRRYYHLKNE